MQAETKRKAQSWERTRYPGIYRVHVRDCSRRRCTCGYQAAIYSTREQRRIRKSFGTLGEARTWREDIGGAIRDGRKVAPSKTTVKQAADALLAGMRDGTIPASGGARYKPATIRGYVVGLDKRVLPALGHMRLSDVRRADVQALADKLTAEGLAASTVANTLDPLRVIFRRAVRREEVAVDPTKSLELRRSTGRRERIASPAEAAELLAALPDEDRALWATAFHAGLRRGELRALRWSDIDLAGRVIRVERGWDAIEGEQDGKSAAARRRVPILDVLAPILVDHAKGTERVGDALVFGATAVKPFNPESVRRRALAAWGQENVKRVKRAADLQEIPDDAELLAPITLHECRHTFASLLIAAGNNAKAVSVAMGHANIAITFDTYGHLMPGSHDEVAAQTNAYLAKLAGKRPALTMVAG